MNTETPRTRLFVTAELSEQATFALDEKQSHYITHVMRLKPSDTIAVFNGKDGEWLATITEAKKRQVTCTATLKMKEQSRVPDLWLLFAPIKLGRIDYLVEKATELGASELFPVRTERTNVGRINEDRLLAHMIEAAEQTERLDVPRLHPLKTLHEMLMNWPNDRALFFCDEAGGGKLFKDLASTHKKYALLIGPEGGFSSTERDYITAFSFTVPISLGPRILRADTAAIAALTALQIQFGDWAA